MSANISFEQMVDSLKDMFNEWDRESLAAILEANGCHIERTIEQCLAMSSESSGNNNNNNNGSGSGPVGAPTPTPAPAPAPLLDLGGDDTSNTSTTTNDNNSNGPETDISSTSTYAAVTSSSSSSERGSQCELPEAFLRPPGYQMKSSGGSASSDPNMLPDAELARLLQDELFQRELRATYGDRYLTGQQQPGQQSGGQPMGQPMPVGNNPNGNMTSATSASNTNTASNNKTMMQSIRDMGAGMKAQLSNLGRTFRAKDRSHRRNRSGGTSYSKKEYDDETETISFMQDHEASEMAVEMNPMFSNADDEVSRTIQNNNSNPKIEK